jgi:hypothetical protein
MPSIAFCPATYRLVLQQAYHVNEPFANVLVVQIPFRAYFPNLGVVHSYINLTVEVRVGRLFLDMLEFDWLDVVVVQEHCKASQSRASLKCVE